MPRDQLTPCTESGQSTSFTPGEEAVFPWRYSREFLLIVVLFVAFRVLTLLAYRPGGLVLDYSDFYYYRDYALLTRQGYQPYVNLWFPYPPLFAWLVVAVGWLSSLLPPWEAPDLWYSLMIGGCFLLFETGNLAMVFLIAHRASGRRWALRSAWFYTVLFVPVYVMTGWFDAIPIFFFLASLYLLIERRPLWSALTTGVGFMFKLVPIVILPIGVRLSRSLLAGDDEAPHGGRWQIRVAALNLVLDVRHVVAYLGVFAATVIAIGLPFYLMNSRILWGSLLMNGVRGPWETVWALLVGDFGYGVAPLDMRNLAWIPTRTPGPSLPWMWISVVFALLYGFLYTRRWEWTNPRAVTAFAGVTVAIFMLYSKGYSPQWLGWILVFVAMLLPTLRGAAYAVLVSVANLVEGNVFFTMVPDEHWLLVLTVGLRTVVFVMLAVEFVLVGRPDWVNSTVVRLRRWALVGLIAIVTIGAVPASIFFVNGYFDARYRMSPYRATIDILRTESQTGDVLVLDSFDDRTYDWLYPYLRQQLTFYMLDDYAPPPARVEDETRTLLEAIASEHSVWWLYDSDPGSDSVSELTAMDFLQNHAELLDTRDVDGGRLYHFRVVQ